jgi:MHS family proline/betaine transporter-like MFS transporter
MLKKLKHNHRVAAMIGTALEYYDMSLYGFMTPILVSVFLPEMSKINAIILTFISLPIGILIRPIGALVIGAIGDKHGRKKGLVVGITGMACVTGLTGLLPTYNDIGIMAPIGMLLCRIMQGFFVAGEYNGGAIFVLEHTNQGNKGLLSGLYCAYTVSGILAASGITTLISKLPIEYWRLPYILGFITGLIGLYIRKYVSETPEFIIYKDTPAINTNTIIKNYKPLLQAITVSGFFGALYNFHTVLLISFLPMVTSFTTSVVMLINFCTTLIYMLLLPVFGHLADKITFQHSMRYAASTVVVCALPLVFLIQLNDIAYIILLKVIFAILTAWFVAPFHAWIQSLFSVKMRYTAVSVSYSIGSQLGGMIPALSLWLWKYSNSLLSIALPLLLWAVLAFFALRAQYDSIHR